MSPSQQSKINTNRAIIRISRLNCDFIHLMVIYKTYHGEYQSTPYEYIISYPPILIDSFLTF